MYSVIIIDDETTIADGIANIFPWSNLGFEVIKTFSNSKEGLSYLNNNKVDVLLCDIQMPGLDGLELVSKIIDKRIKIVYISSYQTFDYLRGAILNQVEDYILKPIKYNELSTCMQRIKEELDVEHGKTAEEKPGSFYDDVIVHVKEYVDKNYQHASLEAAAEEVMLSAGYLSKIFKEHSNIGFQEYLMEVRMSKACEFLQDIKNKSYDVAFYVGYDNPKNFSRAFKNYYGKTISEYRKNYGIICND